MTNLLALLDQAIDGLTSRNTREQSRPEDATVTVTLLKDNDVTVLSVVPVPARRLCRPTPDTAEFIDHSDQEAARRGSSSETTGSTGSTGIDKAHCGFANSRGNGAGGDHGNGQASDEKDRPGQSGLNANEIKAATASARNVKSRSQSRPLLLRDGRWMHEFPAREVPRHAANHVAELVERARSLGAVLVADGLELKIVEPVGALPDEIIGSLREEAGMAIAVLRGESHSRVAGAS